jgi:hypothetical protein
MVDALTPVAFPQLLADQALHHELDPLLANDGISSIHHSLVIAHVDIVERGRYCWFRLQEGLGLGSRHVSVRRSLHGGVFVEIVSGLAARIAPDPECGTSPDDIADFSVVTGESWELAAAGLKVEGLRRVVLDEVADGQLHDLDAKHFRTHLVSRPFIGWLRADYNSASTSTSDTTRYYQVA